MWIFAVYVSVHTTSRFLGRKGCNGCTLSSILIYWPFEVIARGCSLHPIISWSETGGYIGKGLFGSGTQTLELPSSGSTYLFLLSSFSNSFWKLLCSAQLFAVPLNPCGSFLSVFDSAPYLNFSSVCIS